MLRSLVLAALFLSSVSAAVWPEQLGSYQRKSAKALTIEPGVSDEYGFEAGEEADYGMFKVSAYRFKDSTGAYADSLTFPERPLQIGNYLVACTGNCPKDLAGLAESLPRISHASLPTLHNYLPKKNMVPGSERYILGPLSLKQAETGIPGSVVGFDFSAEATLARYRTGQEEATLVIFSYPTPGLARQQVSAFQSLPGAVLKRSGPLLAVALAGAGQTSQSFSQSLLAQISYTGTVTSNEPLPLILTPQSAAQMLLAIIGLAGLVLGVCLASGLVFAGVLFAARKFGYSGAGDAMITLNLSDK
jgi:hypothetical protein